MQKYEMHASVETYELCYRHGLCLPLVIGYPTYTRTMTPEEAYLQGKEHGIQIMRTLENMNNLHPCLDYFADCVVFGRWQSSETKKKGRVHSQLEVDISI
jgi:hypothetical protein